jgi:hypothetical protein
VKYSFHSGLYIKTEKELDLIVLEMTHTKSYTIKISIMQIIPHHVLKELRRCIRAGHSGSSLRSRPAWRKKFVETPHLN